MLNLKSFWAKKTRLKLTFEKIQLVRKERGIEARGDVLLRSAQIALRFKDVCAARQDLENFLQIVRNVSPEQKAVLETECSQISPRWYMKLGPPIKDILIMIFEILLRLTIRHPLSCQQNGNFFRLYRCLKPLKI